MDRRKELKLQYKETKTQRGVFRIKNTVNGKAFVKSSMNLKTINGQLFQLQQHSHKNSELQAEWDEYGKDAFIIDILEELDESKPIFVLSDALKKLEEKWLAALQPYGEQGYNKPEQSE
jgi:hypothetical protein